MVSSRRRALGCALALASLLSTVSAHAEPSAADRETARGLMQQGRELRFRGDEKGALKSFEAADAIMHVPTTGMEVARSQVALGLFVEARDMIATIRKIPAKASDPAPFKEARAKAEELDASMNGRVPALTIWVKGTTEDETPTVTIDDEELPAGVLGLPRAVDPGHHVVEVKSASGEAKQEVDVKEGEQKTVDLALGVPPPPAPVAAEAAPDTDVAPLTPAPEVTSHGPSALTWAGIGLAGAGIAAGTVTGLLSLSKKSTLSNECAHDICGPTSYSDYSSANSLATGSTIAFIAGGVGATIAVVSLVVGHRVQQTPAPPAAARITVLPVVGLGQAGISGTF